MAYQRSVEDQRVWGGGGAGAGAGGGGGGEERE